VAEEETHRDSFTGGSDGTVTSATQYGRSQFTVPTLEASYLGMYALNRIEELMQVIIPDFAGDIQITKDQLDYADSRQSLPSGGDRFIVLVVPQGSTAQEAVDFLRIDVAQYTAYAALYWPWVKVADPLADNRPVVFPPLGHIAGIYARTDSQRNVGKAPAGTVDGALRFLVGLETDTTQGERDYVYPARINPLVTGPQTGLAVWGARTISQQSEWRYIQARRLFMFVEKSIYNSTHWIVFESNGPALWTRIKAQIQSFLNGIYSDGLLAGSNPSQAFFVTVDETNNTQDTINAGQVIIDVGIAPNKPAEFVRFRFSQKSLDS
jgi:phage tail sheath protein FI